jgi:hypothetical protein
MIASLVASAMSAPGSDAGIAAAPSPLSRVSSWLMICHNFLEGCVYAVLAWLLASNNRPYAIAGFISGVVGLLALSGAILVELEILPSSSQQAPMQEPFGIGFGTIDMLLALVGEFSILPANGFFALATLRYSRSRPAVTTILFMGIPIGLINLFIPDHADAWVQFLGDWLVPIFVLSKQLILLWWFTTLLHPEETPIRTNVFAAGLPGYGTTAPANTAGLASSVAAPRKA